MNIYILMWSHPYESAVGVLRAYVEKPAAEAARRSAVEYEAKKPVLGPDTTDSEFDEFCAQMESYRQGHPFPDFADCDADDFYVTDVELEEAAR